jgi:beta-lactamase regulating signal transducer with metallopeptidase domain
MIQNSPLATVSTCLTFFVQIACGYLLTRALSVLFRSHRFRLRLWTGFLALTLVGWIFLSVPAPATRSAKLPILVAQPGSTPQWSWQVGDSLAKELDRLEVWAVWIYLSILSTLLLQLLVKRLRLFLLLRGRREPSPELVSLFDALCEEMKVRRCQLSLLAQLRSPATTGLFRPRVLLPLELVHRLDGDQLAQILRHELIHVKRRDYLWDRLAALSCRVLFFHPAVWLSYRRIRWERELSCDQAVVESSSDSRLPYAECLTSLATWWFVAEKPSATGIGFSSSPSLLATRIKELLSEPRQVSIFERGLRSGLIAVTFLAGALFLPSVALSFYRSSLWAPPSPAATLGSRSRIRAARKKPPLDNRTAVPVQSVDAPARPADPDHRLDMLLSSSSIPMPLLHNSPEPAAHQGVAQAQYERGHSTESGDTHGVWDESSAPKPYPASTTWSDAATAAIRVAIATTGGHDSHDEGSGSEQVNHFQRQGK